MDDIRHDDLAITASGSLRADTSDSSPKPQNAYFAGTSGTQVGLSVWCEDEAGPFQAVPHPGVSWQPRRHPAIQPHEYVRGGTTKILTLFHPASGQVRLQSAERCTNAVLHPWLREHLSAVLAELPAPAPVQDPAATRTAWGCGKRD